MIGTGRICGSGVRAETEPSVCFTSVTGRNRRRRERDHLTVRAVWHGDRGTFGRAVKHGRPIIVPTGRPPR